MTYVKQQLSVPLSLRKGETNYEPDNMPQAILLTDAEGRTCTNGPIRVNGRIVRSIGLTQVSDGDFSHQRLRPMEALEPD